MEIKKRKFKANIVDDFLLSWVQITAINECCGIAETYQNYRHDGIKELAARISGKVVNMVEETYGILGSSYFEAEDNNFEIDLCLFKEI